MLLALDIGSSSVKAAVLRDGKVVGGIVRAPYESVRRGVRVEVEPDAVLGAVAGAVRQLGAAAAKADVIGLSVMSPAWVAMDRRGKPLTPLVTHQDRRSIGIARELVARVGMDRYLTLAGNLPIPGGISGTTWAWFRRHDPALLRRADLVGHLNTFLHRQMTGGRVIDPANASFTGLYSTLDQGGWNDELCAAVGASPSQLPEVREANQVGGTITPEAAGRLGLVAGTPMLVGIVDTSSAMLLTGARPGQLLNVCGSTDVLALCTDRPRAHEKLLTRALGVGHRWMSVSTLAAAGSALAWAKEQLFPDLDWPRFGSLMAELARPATKRTAGKPAGAKRAVAKWAAEKRKGGEADGKSEASVTRFEPYLAGERTSIEQRQASFTGLTLATTRQDMLAAVIESLAEASAARLTLLGQNPVRIRRDVVVSGGVQNGLDEILHRDWPGKWTFRSEDEATLRGLGRLAD